jgi:hypothetical protein
MENMKHLGGNRYVVWTQAGFRKAIRDLGVNADEGDPDPVEGYPKKYPSVVTFLPQFKGYHYWFAKCVPLTRAIETARASLVQLEEIDQAHRTQLSLPLVGDSSVSSPSK